MSNFLNTNEIDKFAESVYEFASKEMPKETKKFIKKEGKNLLQETQREAIFSGVHHKSHKYYDSIKQGRVYKYKQNGAINNRVYSSDQKAHLLEYGHRQVLNPGKDGKVAPIGNGKFAKGVKPGKGIGKEIGFVEGYHIFENSAKRYDGEYVKNCEKFIEDVIIKEIIK